MRLSAQMKSFIVKSQKMVQRVLSLFLPATVLLTTLTFAIPLTKAETLSTMPTTLTDVAAAEAASELEKTDKVTEASIPITMPNQTEVVATEEIAATDSEISLNREAPRAKRAKRALLDETTGSYELSINYTKDTENQAIKEISVSENAKTEVTLDVSGAKLELQNPILKIKAPKAFVKGLQVSGIASEFPYQRSITREGDYYCLNLTFNKLKGADKLHFFVTSTFQEYLTPNQTTAKLQAYLLTASGQTLISSDELPYTIKVASPTFDKSAKSAEQIGGADDDGYVRADSAASVCFEFAFAPSEFGLDNNRAITSGEIRDTLPTYQTKDGQTLTAQLDTSLSKGWTLDTDGKTAVYKIEADGWNIYGITSYHQIEVKPLYLKFPGAKFDTKITNTATYTLVPTQKQANEADFTGTASAEVTLIKGKEIKAKLNKSVDPSEVQDTKTEKAKEQTWKITPIIEGQEGIKQVVITEDPDTNLYIVRLEDKGFSFDDDAFKFIPNIEKVEGKLKDGTYEEVKKKTGGGGFWGDFFGGFGGSSKEWKIENPEKYYGLKITLKPNAIVPAGASFISGASLGVITKFREADKQNGPKTYVNKASFTAVSETSNSPVSQNTEASFALVAFNAPFKFKMTSEQANKQITKGENIDVKIEVANTVPDDDATKQRKIVVIIPDGLDYVGTSPFNSEIYPWSDKIVNKQVLADYNASGKRALIYELNDLKKTNMDDNATGINLRFKVNQLYRSGELKLVAYYSFDGVDQAPLETSLLNNAEKVADQYDINADNKMDDKVGKTELIFNALLPRGLHGYTLIGRDENNLTPYSISLQPDQTATLAFNIFNSDTTPQKGLQIYSVLPYPNDTTIMPNQEGTYPKKGSTVSMQLAGDITPPVGYDVYYLTETPPQEAADALALATWATTVTDWSTVKAFKLVAKSDTELAVNSNLQITVPVKVAKSGPEDIAVASFAYKLTQQPKLVEANTVRVVMPREFTLKKVWQGDVWYQRNKDNYKLPNYPDVDVQIKDKASQKLVQTVTLKEAENWQKEIKLPAYNGVNPANYDFVEVKPTAEYFKDTASKVQINGTTVELVNTLKLKATIKKTFTKDKRTVDYPELPGATLILQKKHVTEADTAWQEYKRFTVAKNQVSASFEELLDIADAQGELTYKLTEANLPDGWEQRGNGQLQLLENKPFQAELSLENAWTKQAEPIQVQLVAWKEIVASKDGANLPDLTNKFTFTLEANDNAPLPASAVNGKVAMTNPNDGKLNFGTISFSLVDLGNLNSKTYTYKVTETGDVADVKNDAETSKQFSLTLRLKDDGELEVAASRGAHGELVKFTNVYQVKELNPPLRPIPSEPESEEIDLVPKAKTGKYIVAKTGETQSVLGSYSCLILLAMTLYGLHKQKAD